VTVSVLGCVNVIVRDSWCAGMVNVIVTAGVLGCVIVIVTVTVLGYVNIIVTAGVLGHVSVNFV